MRVAKVQLRTYWILIVGNRKVKFSLQRNSIEPKVLRKNVSQIFGFKKQNVYKNKFLRKSRQEESAHNLNRKLRHSVGCSVFTNLIIVLSCAGRRVRHSLTSNNVLYVTRRSDEWAECSNHGIVVVNGLHSQLSL